MADFPFPVERNKLCESFLAGADLSAARGCAVKLDADKKVVKAEANETIIGFLDNAPTADREAKVVTGGATVAKLGANVTTDQYLKVDANGELVVADTDEDNVVAQAIGAGSDGELSKVAITKFVLTVPA